MDRREYAERLNPAMNSAAELAMRVFRLVARESRGVTDQQETVSTEATSVESDTPIQP